MEQNLFKNVDLICQTPGVKGCLLADAQGLCLAGTKGKMTGTNSGVVVAIADHVKLFEPHSVKEPIVIFESDQKQLYIHQHGELTAAILKS